MRCARHASPAARASARRAARRGRPDTASPRPPGQGGARGASFGVTPRQACPRPDGLGRNLRSKTRWFTGFCNSHQVSHFATFFIDARAEISVAESRVDLTRGIAPPDGQGRPGGAGVSLCSLTPSAPWVLLRPGGLGCLARERSAGRGDAFAVCFGQGHDNDPSAGSPTETLLRLLLPLNDKVQWTSRDVGGGEPPPSPRSEHFTGPFNR